MAVVLADLTGPTYHYAKKKYSWRTAMALQGKREKSTSQSRTPLERLTHLEPQLSHDPRTAPSLQCIPAPHGGVRPARSSRRLLDPRSSRCGRVPPAFAVITGGRCGGDDGKEQVAATMVQGERMGKVRDGRGRHRLTGGSSMLTMQVVPCWSADVYQNRDSFGLGSIVR